MAERDTPGEGLASISMVLVATGARTEVTETTSLVGVLAMVVPDPAWTSPPSPFPPSSSLLDKEEDKLVAAVAEEEV